jgi:hypothetical protein
MGPKFRPQNTKGAEKNCVEPGKFRAKLLTDLSKKGPNFFVVLFCTKIVIFFADIYRCATLWTVAWNVF